MAWIGREGECIVTPERDIGSRPDPTVLRPGPGGSLAPQEVLEVMLGYATEPYRG